jgi:molybdopterin biosynthesis enzyme
LKTITTLKEALEKIKQLKSTYYFKRESEHVSIPDSLGRELSENIVADYMSPAFDGSVYAGDQRAQIKRGEAMAIATGAVPDDYDKTKIPQSFRKNSS